MLYQHSFAHKMKIISILLRSKISQSVSILFKINNMACFQRGKYLSTHSKETKLKIFYSIETNRTCKNSFGLMEDREKKFH